MVRLRRIPYDAVSWEKVVDSYEDAEVFHSAAWLAFLHATKGITPIVAELADDAGDTVGHFVGGAVRALGIRVLGSPFSDWGTRRMGFLLRPGVDRGEAAKALLDFAYQDLGCFHVEIRDQFLRADTLSALSFLIEPRETFEVDLTGSEDDVLTRMHSRTRTYVRRGPRIGLRVEEVSGVGFADEYYTQLLDVFGSKSLVPMHGVERVRSLIETVEPSGQLGMLRVRDPEGDPVASIITLGRQRRSALWGLAWHRAAAKLHAVELIQWAAMSYWRERGATVYDLDGTILGKEKFGGSIRTDLQLRHSRYPVLERGRDAVRAILYARQRVQGRFRARTAARSGE
jgi:hypothetical protein